VRCCCLEKRISSAHFSQKTTSTNNKTLWYIQQLSWSVVFVTSEIQPLCLQCLDALVPLSDTNVIRLLKIHLQLCQIKPNLQKNLKEMKKQTNVNEKSKFSLTKTITTPCFRKKTSTHIIGYKLKIVAWFQ